MKYQLTVLFAQVTLLFFSNCVHYVVSLNLRQPPLLRRLHTNFAASSEVAQLDVIPYGDEKSGKKSDALETGGVAASADGPPRRVYQGSGSRVYKPRTDNPKGNFNGVPTQYNRNSPVAPSSPSNPNYIPSKEALHLLQSPQLLIRYRVPREKSELKSQLEALQEMYREQSADSFRSSRESTGSYSSSRSNYPDHSKDNSHDSFDAMFSSSGDNKKGGTKGKAAKEAEKKRSEGGKAKVASDRRSKDEEEDVEYEVVDDEDDAEEEEESDDYYGDEANRSLSSIPSGNLRNMENEGHSLEEIQMMLYGEYGVKASLTQIKRRLLDDKSERRGGKKTGKTRRDRSKARRARFAPDADQGVRLPDSGLIQIIELAKSMDVGGGEVVKHLMLNMGMMVSMTQSIDVSVAKQVVEAFGKKLVTDGDNTDDDEDDEEDDDDDMMMTTDGVSVERLTRPPIVTIMGHVDHGKTSLLDSIRSTKVAKGEAGGITQGISAFKVATSKDQFITFIDTPGHAAFSEMRKRGANVTDIVVLVVAADDGIMEQTKECIYAAKAAGCPIVVAVNKIDKEGANADKVITDLMKYDVLVEEFGGEVQCAKVSAKAGTGIEDLLDKVMLQAEVMALKAPVSAKAEGSVIEARVDKGLGVVVTVLVQSGTLKVGDYVLAGPSWGRVRRLISDQKKELKEAGPSTPVQIIGMNGVPNAGDTLSVTANEAGAREVAEARQRLSRQASGTLSNAAIIAQAVGFAEGVADMKEIIKVPFVLKGDVAGSIEALRSSIDSLQLSDDEATCKADIVFAGVGDVTSSDVATAAASKAKVLAFNVAASLNAMDDARSNNVNIGYYNVVYNLLDEVEEVIRTTLAPPPPGTLVGRAEIKKVFKLGKVGKVAGCSVTEGLLKADSQVRVMRGKRNPVFTGKFSSLKVVKDSVAEVPSGSECGASFEDFQDFEEGDIIECFV